MPLKSMGNHILKCSVSSQPYCWSFHVPTLLLFRVKRPEPHPQLSIVCFFAKELKNHPTHCPRYFNAVSSVAAWCNETLLLYQLIALCALSTLLSEFWLVKILKEFFTSFSGCILPKAVCVAIDTHNTLVAVGLRKAYLSIFMCCFCAISCN